MGGIRAEAVFGDNHLKMGMILTKLGDEAFGRVALAIIFLGTILFDNGLGHEWNHFALVRVDERRTQHLVGIRHRAISVVFFQTRLAVNLFGREIASAIESEQVMALDKNHRFKGFATLKAAKPNFKCRSQVLGLKRIE